jgi:hypothetical protein
MSDDALLDFKLDDLREQAIERAWVLADQLESDHADLLRCKDRGKTSQINAGIENGIERVSRALAAAQQLRLKLQSG